MATKRAELFECVSCGITAPKWTGRCGTCDEWNSLIEVSAVRSGSPTALPPRDMARPITEVATLDFVPVTTGLPELDRVLGGGLVAGSVTLLGGEPGTGKSTLALQLAAARARFGTTVLYVSGEESAEQVALRAHRLGALEENLHVVTDTVLPRILERLDEVKPGLLIIDSVQTLHDPEVRPAPGSVAQVRHCAHRLTQVSKQRAMASFIVGHVTKDGSLAGPRVLEHIVDTVLRFDVDSAHEVRLLRAVKHRFGATGELGLLRMQADGLHTVADPSSLFLLDRRSGKPGSAVVAAIDGRRPILHEIQALVASTNAANPRRSTQGIESARLAMVMAVLSELCGSVASRNDVYVALVGGSRLTDPGCDLAMALALASSERKLPLPDGLVVFGEVGLTGEIRLVGQPERRLAEASRMGFDMAIVPPGLEQAVPGITAIEVSTIVEACTVVGL
jgi:DNA repair protein RadA/Sms